jgi:hypothetical protein
LSSAEGMAAAREGSPARALRATDRLWLLGGLGAVLAVLAFVTQVLPASAFDDLHVTSGSALTRLFPGHAGEWRVIVTFLGLMAVFVAALWAAGGVAGKEAERLALAGACALALVFVAAYPTSSFDVFKYVADTRTLTVYHQNPLRVAPQAHPQDPLYAHIPAGQARTAGFYGPLFYVAAAPASLLAGDSPSANLVAFKLLNAAALLAMVAVVWRAVRAFAPERAAQAVVFLGWNPYVLYEGVGNAHNDLLMVALCLTGAVAAARAGPVRGLALWAAGAAIKYVTALTAPVLFLWLWRSHLGRTRLAIGAAALAVGLAGLALLATDPNKVRALGIFNETAFRTPYAYLLHLQGDRLTESSQRVGRVVCLGAFALVLAAVLLRQSKSERSLYAGMFWLLAAASAFTVAYAWPWYFLWCVPFAALLPASTERDFALALSVSAMLTTALYPYAQHGNAVFYQTGVMYGLPLLALPPSLWLRRAQGRAAGPDEGAGGAASQVA